MVISWYFIFPWQKGTLGISLGLAHLDSENVFASHCPTNCFSCLRKTGFKKVAQPNLKWFILSSSCVLSLLSLSLSLFCPTSYNVKYNLTYAMPALMTLRLYGLMIIFLNAKLSLGTKGHFWRQ